MFHKFFKFINGHIVITNYRLLFVPILEQLNLQPIWQKQPQFVKNFFNIPLGYISRCEKNINPLLENPKSGKYAYNNS